MRIVYYISFYGILGATEHNSSTAKLWPNRGLESEVVRHVPTDLWHAFDSNFDLDSPLSYRGSDPLLVVGIH